MKIRKYKIKIFYNLEAVDAMCCERIVSYHELRDIVDALEDALALNIQVEYRVKAYYETDYIREGCGGEDD